MPKSQPHDPLPSSRYRPGRSSSYRGSALRPSTLAISNAKVTVISGDSTKIDFPIWRGGDTSYDAFVQYQTKNGTAIAGKDYTAASGSLVIPAGTTSTTIPVTVAGSKTNPPAKTFQMLLLGGGGAPRSFTPSFTAQKTFDTDVNPQSVTAADVNGDGEPDLIVANFGSDKRARSQAKNAYDLVDPMSAGHGLQR
jgi:hypothetical protein